MNQECAFRPNSNRPVNRQFLIEVYSGIPYANFFDDASGRYSIDSVLVKFVFGTEIYDFASHEKQSTLDHQCFFIDQFRDNVDVTWSEQSFRIGKYSRTAKCSFRNGSSASFMIGRYCFNERHGIAPVIIADFNPNKVPFEDLKPILFGLSLDALSVSLQRFDLAIDIPENRCNVYLQNQGRATYQMIAKSESDRTEYLGKRNSNNRVKLYNKSLELGLDSSVSRCEVTLERFSSIANHVPDVYFRSSMQLGIDFSNLDFAVKACVLHPDLIPELKRSVSPNTWKKHKKIIDSMSGMKLSPVDIAGIDRFIKGELLRYTQPDQWRPF